MPYTSYTSYSPFESELLILPAEAYLTRRGLAGDHYTVIRVS